MRIKDKRDYYTELAISEIMLPIPLSMPSVTHIYGKLKGHAAAHTHKTTLISDLYIDYLNEMRKQLRAKVVSKGQSS